MKLLRNSVIGEKEQNNEMLNIKKVHANESSVQSMFF